MEYLHPDLADGRWHTMTLAEQLGNVGSDYERALRWKQKGNREYFESALARMLELLDLTISDPRWRNHRLKELCRLREVVCDELLNEVREYPDPRDFKNYFYFFAYTARKNR
ncbi:MAG TPA: hypothetical protein VNG71_13130 [Pyrinomonadaceae bacterium]|nr:hypothetical protein [Pyrinomonadaceae bacterium]